MGLGGYAVWLAIDPQQRELSSFLSGVLGVHTDYGLNTSVFEKNVLDEHR